LYLSTIFGITMLEETPEEREVFSAMEQSSVRKESIRQMDKFQSIMEELALARMLIRELGDRLAKLEKENGVPVGVGGRLTTTSEQEPVEWGVDWGKDGNSVSIIKRLADGNIEVLGWEYAPHPPQRTWVGLTDEEIADCAEKMEASDPTDSFWREFFRGIEAKLKEKNT
jgi:hypothetical protein